MRLICLLLAFWMGATAAAERVISLAPSLTDTVLELGAADRLVGILEGGERPAGLEDVPSVGRYGHVNLERILALQPDLVLVWTGSVPDAQLQKLREFGIPLYISEPRTLDEIAVQLATIGRLLGRPEQGEALSAAFRLGVGQLSERYRRATPLRVFYQIWHQPMYTIGGRQVISDALRHCGAENIFADLSLPAPQVSVEAVLARNPDVILMGSHGQGDIWQDWPQLTAARLKQIYPISDKNLERPSFAMLAAIQSLCELLSSTQTAGN